MYVNQFFPTILAFKCSAFFSDQNAEVNDKVIVEV